jgi:hypothetical protein
MCPYYLDGDRTLRIRGCGSVIPVVAVLIVTANIGYCAVFKGRREAPAGLAGRSLKTQQHAPAKAPRYAELAEPGPVDILGRTVDDRSHRADRDEGDRPASAPCRTGPLLGAP